MNDITERPKQRIDAFFSTPAAREDRWRDLVDAAKAWAAGTVGRDAFDAALSNVAAIEEFHGYPGPALMEALRYHAEANDPTGTGTLAFRISTALLSRSFRQHAADWDLAAEISTTVADVLPPALGRSEAAPPYFEVLIVTGAPMERWFSIRSEWRRLRRPQDAFVYEPVIVGSAEDAVCAVMLNPDLAAVVIHEGFVFHSRHDAPVLRSMIDPLAKLEASDASAMRLSRVLNQIRPELDLYMLSNRRVEEIAGDPAAAVVRRVFYAVEEPLELHLAILEGVQARYETPFFDNLKKYAQRPIGTFHALPIARGKSVFKSDWIRDMGEFYGPTLFLAESSATTGGLDSLLEPTGNIKRAQELAARAFGADRVFFVTNGTSTSNKMVVQALLSPW
jgi:arginine decarboxylase